MFKLGFQHRRDIYVTDPTFLLLFYAGSIHFYGPPYPEGYFVQDIQMDFFNYAGLHRPVRLYTTPSSIHLDDITTVTSINSDGSATLHYTLEVTKIEQKIIMPEMQTQQ